MREKKEEKETLEEEIRSHLDTRLLENPSFAIETAKREVIRMGELALSNVKAGAGTAVSRTIQRR